MTQTGSTPQAADTTWPSSLVSMRSPAEQLVLTSYEKSVLTLEEYAKLVIDFSKSKAEKTRRAATQKRINILKDSWAPLLKASFQNWNSPPVVEAVMGANGDHTDLSSNPAKNIWQELAVTYKLPPKRFTPDNEADGQRYLELLEDTHFDLFWQHVELLLEATNEVLIWPDVIKRGNGQKKIKHRYATGANCTIITMAEDSGEIECVLIHDAYTDLEGNKHLYHILWSDNWHAKFEEQTDGEYVRIGFVDPEVTPESDDSAANPYGEIPMHLIRLNAWQDSIWDQTSGEDLVDMTLRSGEDRLYYRYNQKMHGFKQPAVIGPAIDKMPQQLRDPGYTYRVDGDGSLQIIDWSIDLKARLECQMMDELRAAASRGINPERYKKTASYQTTIGAKSAERGLQERRVRNSPTYKTAEKAYKRKFCIVVKAHGIERPPSPDVALEVQHAPMIYPEDPLSQIAVEEKELAMAMESNITLLQRRRPELSNEEARQIIEDNMKAIAFVNDMKVKHNVPNDPTKESASAEINGAKGPFVRDNMQALPGPLTGKSKGDKE